MRTTLSFAMMAAIFLLAPSAPAADDVEPGLPPPDVVVVEPAPVPVEPVPQESQWTKFKASARQAGDAIATGTKNTAEKAADGAQRAGSAVVSGSKKAGHAIADGYEDAKDYVKEKVD